MPWPRDDRCASCRFWLGEADQEGWRLCWRATSARRADSYAGTADAASPLPPARMLASAADDWELCLETAPDFGCVEWRPIGAGVPHSHARHALIFPDGHVGMRGGGPPDDVDQPRPEYPADHTGVLARQVEPLRQQVADASQGKLRVGFMVECVSVQVEVIGPELFERTWAEAVAEARVILARMAQQLYKSAYGSE
jgi:hypothetical protein